MDDRLETPPWGPVEPEDQEQIYHWSALPPRQISSGKLNEIIHCLRLLSACREAFFNSPPFCWGEFVGCSAEGGWVCITGGGKGTRLCTLCSDLGCHLHGPAGLSFQFGLMARYMLYYDGWHWRASPGAYRVPHRRLPPTASSILPPYFTHLLSSTLDKQTEPLPLRSPFMCWSGSTFSIQTNKSGLTLNVLMHASYNFWNSSRGSV